MFLIASICQRPLIKVIRSKYSDNTHSFLHRRLLAEPGGSSDGPTWSLVPLCRQRSIRGRGSFGVVILSRAAFWRSWSRPRIRSRSLGSSRTGKRSGSIDDGFGLFMAASRRGSPQPLLLRSGGRFGVPGASLPAGPRGRSVRLWRRRSGSLSRGFLLRRDSFWHGFDRIGLAQAQLVHMNPEWLSPGRSLHDVVYRSALLYHTVRPGEVSIPHRTASDISPWAEAVHEITNLEADRSNPHIVRPFASFCFSDFSVGTLGKKYTRSKGARFSLANSR